MALDSVAMWPVLRTSNKLAERHADAFQAALAGSVRGSPLDGGCGPGGGGQGQGGFTSLPALNLCQVTGSGIDGGFAEFSVWARKRVERGPLTKLFQLVGDGVHDRTALVELVKKTCDQAFDGRKVDPQFRCSLVCGVVARGT